MTIFIEDFVMAGYCRWENGKIIVSVSCPEDVRRQLRQIDEEWRCTHPKSGSIVIYMEQKD